VSQYTLSGRKRRRAKGTKGERDEGRKGRRAKGTKGIKMMRQGTGRPPVPLSLHLSFLPKCPRQREPTDCAKTQNREHRGTYRNHCKSLALSRPSCLVSPSIKAVDTCAVHFERVFAIGGIIYHTALPFYCPVKSPG